MSVAKCPEVKFRVSLGKMDMTEFASRLPPLLRNAGYHQEAKAFEREVVLVESEDDIFPLVLQYVNIDYADCE